MRQAFAAIALIAGLAGVPSVQAGEVTPLVTADWLIQHSADENLVVLDIRGDVEKTDLGDKPYIANAVVAPYGTAGWRTEIDGVPGMLPEIKDVVALIAGLGIDNNDHVVVVPWGTDSSEFGGATRVYWTFKYLGHDSVSILDGGWRQYDAAGGARAVTPRKPIATTFDYSLRKELLATTDDVQAALERGVKLVDGRPAAQYHGESKSKIVRVKGTLPGAINIPNGDLYSNKYAEFVSPETMQSSAAAVNLGANEENIVFCNTGHWASVVWFGLSEIQGNKATSMYDGSMAAWAADISRPVVIQ